MHNTSYTWKNIILKHEFMVAQNTNYAQLIQFAENTTVSWLVSGSDKLVYRDGV